MAEQAFNSFAHHTGEKPVVLIADDSHVVRVSLKNILADSCQLIEAEDGQQAWELLCEHPAIALIFSDLSMPRLDGRGLLAKLRGSESEHLANLPFIVVTGNEESLDIVQELQQLGATGVINKPFDASKITGFIATLTQEQAEGQEEASLSSHVIESQSEFLTDVADKAHFMECASRELSFAIRNKNELAITLIKIDQFAEIANHYSDPAIEHILLTLTEIIRQHIHPDDTLAYFGAGLYAALRPASNAIGTRYIGRRVLEDLSSKQFYLGESNRIVSASIGISAPDIKPGIRLSDVLSLAEGRLKAAMDSGGNKVVDKGNENLTPVTTSSDMSALSNPTNFSVSPTSDSSLSLSRSPTEIHRLAAEHVAQIKARYGNDLENHNEQQNDLGLQRQAIERLTSENQQLIEEVERWRKQSAESEHLRRQLFEVESQQQHLQLKLNELQAANDTLQQRAEAAEYENHRLINEEEERTAALRQAQQFVEEENRRQESQISELVNRAEKAELASRKSDQLVGSLRDNIKLLRMQLDQMQQQLAETQNTQAQQIPDRKENSDSANRQEAVSQPLVEPEIVGDPQDSDLSLSAMPSAARSDQSTPPSVHLFPEKDQIESKKQVSESRSIPPFRVEPEPLLFKNGFNLSSFTIASIILCVILFAGGLYLYLVIGVDPNPEMTASSQQLPADSKPAMPSRSPDKPHAGPPPVNQTTNGIAAMPAPPAKTVNQDHNSRTRDLPVSDETRLTKELLLRQIAEEEFNRKAQQSPVATQAIDPRPNPITIDGMPSQADRRSAFTPTLPTVTMPADNPEPQSDNTSPPLEFPADQQGTP
ncbi:MAG: response regulator [Candidatus Thiodiazotropha sp. (ex Epidulcina cf. delphinae)]|nr:response regulator [Candidatus Thiodiazotropha sp. (ex Epidulcina cf. delphinae)]